MIKDVGHRFRWCERASAHDSDLAVTIYDAAGGIADNGAYVTDEGARRSQTTCRVREYLRQLQQGSLRLHDEKSLLMYNHISRDKGASGVWRTALSAKEIKRLNDRYATWIRDAGYEQ